MTSLLLGHVSNTYDFISNSMSNVTTKFCIIGDQYALVKAYWLQTVLLFFNGVIKILEKQSGEKNVLN